jgi:glycosyltransferase involved in cell wall biosynthesis
MRHPTLLELPPPPLGKTGWPWTVETPALPSARPEGSAWPRISIITPSYNQGQFIEETIRSVLLQGYPDLEYIIIDGGSRDQTVQIIKEYEPWLSYWVSEQDRGQSHAINKGFDQSTGLILGWLNSDDILLPDALATVAVNSPHPDEPMLIAGTAEIRDVSLTRVIMVLDRIPRTFFDVFSQFDTCFPQPSVFFTRKALKLTGVLREDLHYAMDLELWLRMAQDVPITVIEQHLSWWRTHEDSKTWSNNPLPGLEEGERVLQSYSRFVPARIAKRTFASSRRAQSWAWIGHGKSSIVAGDRKNALVAAYKAARLHVRTIGSLPWMGLVLQIVLPRSIRQLVFDAHAGH